MSLKEKQGRNQPRPKPQKNFGEDEQIVSQHISNKAGCGPKIERVG